MYNNVTEAKCTGFQFDIRENRTGKRTIIWKLTKALAKTYDLVIIGDVFYENQNNGWS